MRRPRSIRNRFVVGRLDRHIGEVYHMLPSEAIESAAKEGLTFARKASTPFGFWGVGKNGNKFKAQVRLLELRLPGAKAKPTYLGTFECAEEAALTIARKYPQAAELLAEMEAKSAADTATVALTIERVEEIAKDEGLTLLRDPASRTGWRGVNQQHWQESRTTSLT